MVADRYGTPQVPEAASIKQVIVQMHNSWQDKWVTYQQHIRYDKNKLTQFYGFPNRPE